MNRRVMTMEELKDSQLLYNRRLPSFGYILVLVVAGLITAVVAWSIKTSKNYTITSSGTVQSVNKNYIMSPFTGEITDVCMNEGDNVEEGDILFTVKSTDLNIQGEQLEGQKAIYTAQITQYQKLVDCIKDDTNYFDATNTEDSLYYSQYETYKSQVAQQIVDTTTYQAYGYTDEQIEGELVKNQSKVTELYYTALKNAEASLQECQMQLDSIQAQLDAVGSGQKEYSVAANTTGKLHLLSDYKEGMVVQATTALASIASEQDIYIIQAYVSASDAARINENDTVDIAVSGLAQGVYGTIGGKVTQIDSDVSITQSGNEKNQEAYFKVQIQPDNGYLISKNGDIVNISNGMSVETRIQYDKITYFEYVLDSLGVLVR